MTPSSTGTGTHRLALVCLIACAGIAVACAGAPRGLLSGVESPPDEIRQACALATTRCSHCHPLDRVVMTRGGGTRRWEVTVEQMRLKPSSGISPADAQVIIRCLRFVEESCTECKQGRS